MITCEYCSREFELGEDVFVLIAGVYGISPKSQQGAVLDEREAEYFHPSCFIEALMEHPDNAVALFQVREKLREEIEEELMG